MISSKVFKVLMFCAACGNVLHSSATAPVKVSDDNVSVQTTVDPATQTVKTSE